MAPNARNRVFPYSLQGVDGAESIGDLEGDRTSRAAAVNEVCSRPTSIRLGEFSQDHLVRWLLTLNHAGYSRLSESARLGTTNEMR